MICCEVARSVLHGHPRNSFVDRWGKVKSSALRTVHLRFSDISGLVSLVGCCQSKNWPYHLGQKQETSGVAKQCIHICQRILWWCLDKCKFRLVKNTRSVRVKAGKEDNFKHTVKVHVWAGISVWSNQNLHLQSDRGHNGLWTILHHKLLLLLIPPPPPQWLDWCPQILQFFYHSVPLLQFYNLVHKIRFSYGDFRHNNIAFSEA